MIVLPSSLIELEIDQIVDQEGSWMRMILKSLLIFNTVFVRILFFQTFCENTLRFFKIIFGYCSQMNKLICSCFHKPLDIFWCTILY